MRIRQFGVGTQDAACFMGETSELLSDFAGEPRCNQEYACGLERQRDGEAEPILCAGAIPTK
jgi:hypothetical protein